MIRALSLGVFCMLPAAAFCQSLPDAVDRVSASVIAITVELDPSKQQAAPNTDKPKVKIIGAAVVLTPEGHIITAAHLLNAAEKITVEFSDGRKAVAQLMGKDPLTAVAVLKVDAPGTAFAVRFGNSDRVRRGQTVFSISEPFGLRGTVSTGIVAAITRGAAGPYQVLQSNEPVRPGSAGAPLFNLDGEVVGMASANYTQAGKPTGIGFAVASNAVKDIAGQLQRSGVVERGYLGLRMRKPNEQETKDLGFSPGEGVIVVQVLNGGPAASSEIVPGDAIASMNGRPIGNLSAFVNSVFDTPPEPWSSRGQTWIPAEEGWNNACAAARSAGWKHILPVKGSFERRRLLQVRAECGHNRVRPVRK